MNICICGGGNLGHVVSGFLAATSSHRVSVLTRSPERWRRTLVINTPEGKKLQGRLVCVSDQPQEVLADADMVLLCLPGFAIAAELDRIAPALRPDTLVGSIVSSTGFFFQAIDKLPQTQPLFGFQRVPFISRLVSYGQEASLLGYKASVSVAIERCEQKEQVRRQIEQMLKTPTELLANYYEASLTNSNPLLHPSRLYTLWRKWQEGTVYGERPYFYEDWTVEASALYMALDREFQLLLHKLPVREGSIPTVLDYYESHDALSLTDKLCSIKAFQGIKAPMLKVKGGYIPDFKSRYFTEDFPYGLGIVHRLAHNRGLAVPIIDEVYRWGTAMLQQAQQ